jgi:hypothetical protein
MALIVAEFTAIRNIVRLGGWPYWLPPSACRQSWAKLRQRRKYSMRLDYCPLCVLEHLK